MGYSPHKGDEYLEIFNRQIGPAERAFRNLSHEVNLSEGDCVENVARLLKLQIARHFSSPFKILVIGKLIRLITFYVHDFFTLSIYVSLYI